MGMIFFMTNRKVENEGFNESQYRKDVAAAIVQEVQGLVFQHEREFGSEKAHALAMTILSSVLSTLFYNGMAATANAVSNLTDDESAQAGYAKYMQLRTDLEGAVSSGVEAAMHAFNPDQYPDYECNIRLIDAAKVPKKFT